MKASDHQLQYAQQILNFIKERDHFLLSAHINADGDAIASVIAMHLLIRAFDKQTVMIFHDASMDRRFDYLKDFSEIMSVQSALPDNLQIESSILLDVPGYKRLGDVSKLLPEKDAVVKIDHHPAEDVMGHIDWVDEKASSSTAMVYEIIELAGVTIDTDLAQAVYTGILYDTGRFSFSNTTARDLFICSRMVENGVNPAEITNRIFFENSFNALKTIGKGLYSLENHLDGQVNIIYLSLSDMGRDNQHEIEELANYSVAIRGGKIGLFIREVKPRYHKVSLRSKCNVDVNVVAKAFNGGGHTRAAGCRIEGTKQDIIPQLLQEIEKQL